MALSRPQAPPYPLAVNPEPGRPGCPDLVMPSMILHPASRRLWSLALAALAAGAGSGCTSVLSTASLRDILIGVDDRSADKEIPSGPRDEGDDEAAEDTADAERREAAIEEAIHRLVKLGELDDAARDSLVATLQRTDQEDWPVVVEAFAESLASSPSRHVAAKADLDTGAMPGDDAPRSVPDEQPEPKAAIDEIAAPEPETLVPASPKPSEPAEVVSAPAPPSVAVSMPATLPTQPQEAVAPMPKAPAPDAVTEAAPTAAEELALRNTCFATRVQAWGVLDRFASDRFRPGQEVIVYFELDGLTAGESAAGHTTCIDSRLRLVKDDGSTVHEWTFEPIAETCRARRHDYFARYMIRIPAGATAGPHRVELAVTDTLSGRQATEAIDLEILVPPHAAE